MSYRVALAGFALILVPGSLLAGVGPEIAYQEQHQNGDEIYLINPDGTGRVLVYKGATKNFVNGLDMRPGGGELAVSFRTKLFIVDYDDRGVRTGPARSIPLPNPGCTVGALDYHPSDGSLVMSQACGSTSYKVYRLPPGASTFESTPLLDFNVPTAARWSRSGTKLYYIKADQGIFAYDPSSATSAQVQPAGWGLYDLLLQGEQSVWNVSGGPTNLPEGTYKIGDLNSGVQRDGCRLATTIHFGSNDTRMVFRTPLSAGGYNVMVQNADCSGAPFSLTGKGAFYYVDWRAP